MIIDNKGVAEQTTAAAEKNYAVRYANKKIAEETAARVAADASNTNYLLDHISDEMEARQAAQGDLSDLATAAKSNLVAAINEVKDSFDTFTAYSTTPVQIGTWIDGTPIWRVVFKRAFTTEEAEDGTIQPLTGVVVFATYVKFIVSGRAVMLMSLDSPCITDDKEMAMEWDATFSYQGDWTQLEGVCGYVEFVTPESNIITN